MNLRKEKRIYITICRSNYDIESQFVKVGKRVAVSLKNISRFKNLEMEINENGLKCYDGILPKKEAGRYSRYNCEGRQIKRYDLPKIDKTFWGECYPYGNTNAAMVSYSYTKPVYQVEEWLPTFYEIKMVVEEVIENEYIVLFEVDTTLNKTDKSFWNELLFVINLLQENIGDFEIYAENSAPKSHKQWEEVDWELLPPGKLDEKLIKKYFGNKSRNERKELLERYNYIQSLKPKNMIKGTNIFSKYFGAKFYGDIVVLENVENGNAIYVFQ